MTEEEMRAEIKRRAGTNVSELARTLGVAPTYLHNVLRGKRISDALARRLGYRRVETVEFVRAYKRRVDRGYGGSA